MFFGLFGGGKKSRKALKHKREKAFNKRNRSILSKASSLKAKTPRVPKNRDGYERDRETGRWVKKCGEGSQRSVQTGRCRKNSTASKTPRVLKNRDGYERDGESGRWVKKCAAGFERFVQTGRCRKGAQHGPMTKRAFKAMANRQFKALIAKRARKNEN
jgi:hypothetical protein